MPSVFDTFGPFENSLRSYDENGSYRPRACPQGIHASSDCICDLSHECKRPHCSNDIPLDPCCKLSNGTPYGVPITSWPTNRCHEPPPHVPMKPVSPFSCAITDRLYSTPTHSSAAKNRSNSAGRLGQDDQGHESGNENEALEFRRDGSVGKKIGSNGSRLISQLVQSDLTPGKHDACRRDGGSPLPTRRARLGSGGGDFKKNDISNGFASRRYFANRSFMNSNSRTTNGHVSRKPPRSSESEFSSTEASSSPEPSPICSPSLLTPSATPNRVLSPKNNCSGTQFVQERAVTPARIGSTPRPAVARFSAVFAGCNQSRFKPVPLNKSASDGVERMRSLNRKHANHSSSNLHSALSKVPSAAPSPSAAAGQHSSRPPAGGIRPLSPSAKSLLNDTKVFMRTSIENRNELLINARMVLETLTPETDSASCPIRGGGPSGFPQSPRTTWPNSSGIYKKGNGRSHKDLSRIMNAHGQVDDDLQDDILARSEEEVATSHAWLDAEQVWLIHKSGFCGARLLREGESGESLSEGRVRLKLEHNDELFQVDEDDVEKANPPQFDRCEDLSQLRYLNESSVLHTLRQRFGSNLVHTYAGSSMVVINPTTPLAVYSEKVIQMFKGCKLEDMPPHIYSAAQSTYRDLLNTRRDQSLIFLGRSGAGKTTNFRHVLHYLALAAGSPNKILTVERLNAIYTLLEAFGNSRTILNINGTRFTQIFSLDFDPSGQIASASVQVYLPEKMRVVQRPEGEPNFHIFYQLLSGIDEDLRSSLFLDNMTERNLFMTPLQRAEDKQRAGISWARIRASLDIIGVSQEEQKAIWCVLAAIYHLGIAGAARVGNSSKFQFDKPGSAQKAATLLGTSIEELSRSIFSPSATSNRGSSFSRRPSPTERPADRPEGLDALEGMVCGLYAETFNAVIALINRRISTSAHTANSILIVDGPGFQNPATCGRSGGAAFTDMCHNYIQERLQMLFHDITFTAQTDRYTQEHIECNDVADELGTPAPLISLIDKASTSSVVRTSQVDLREADRRGLLWLLDEEAIFPGSSDHAFLERFLSHYSDREYSTLIKPCTSESFMLNHFQGSNPVTYCTRGWLKASRENPIMRNAAALLQESNKENVSRLYVFCRGPVSNTISGSIVGIEGSQSLRRASSIRRAFTTGTAGIKRNSVCLQLKFTVDGIIETLRRTKLRFVHCLLPQHNAGHCELRNLQSSPSKGSPSTSLDESLMNVPLLRSQIRGCQILDSLRIHKQGFPEHLHYAEFRRRFAVLAPSEDRPRPPIRDEKLAVQTILPHLDLDTSSYRLGLSQIFFRTGTISHLEEERDLVLTDTVTRLQARCRGLLARRTLQKRKVQETAIRCIQKNVRKFMAVRDWPWWRLLIRVTPLLNVHRTEEELQAVKDELEGLKVRLEKADKERTSLKLDNDKLESRLAESTAELSEQHSTAQLAAERLEGEQAERMKLEKEVAQLQSDVKKMTSANDRLELERLAMRNEVLQHAELNGDIHGGFDHEASDSSSLYRRKYEWSLKEMELMKKQLKQQQDDDLDQHLLLKKQLEKKVFDANQEADEQRQVVGQLKKKSQRLQAEMNDLKILLEEQTSRNNLLEKKQRKFDQDMSNLHEQLKTERTSKEKVQRERDQTLSEKYSFEQEVVTLKLELELKEEKISTLKKELEELSFTGKAEEETAILKKAKHDLELKVKDQEEELDDLAGQVQMLEAARVRLEMSVEQMRKENRKEAQQRDEELEELRLSSQKKVKAVEIQLESEHSERTQLVREKHELERRLEEVRDQQMTSIDEDYVLRLRKELRKTKALLKDTQTMLEKSQSEGGSKILLRQLKTQLEDAEFAKTTALKARQCAEGDMLELQSQLDDALRAKKDTEDRYSRAQKEKSDIQTQLEESEEEMVEVMKKYKSSVSQLSVDQITISEQTQVISELEHDKQILNERLMELSSKVEVLEGETANIHTQKRLQMKIKELESKLDLELTTRQRLDNQISRLKDQVERLGSECNAAHLKEAQAMDSSKKISRQLRESKEDFSTIQQKHTEAVGKKQELEKQLEFADAEILTVKSDLKLAFKRIEDLQQALQGEISDSDSEISDSKDEQILSKISSERSMSVISEDSEAEEALGAAAAAGHYSYRESFA